MPIGDDTYAHDRRYLQHLEKSGKTYFVTFATKNRWTLPESSRDITLDRCVFEHRRSLWLHTAVVMPDHVHLLLTPHEGLLLGPIVGGIKSVSSRLIKRSLDRREPVWQREYFDRTLRSDEDLRRKGDYIAMNPVRAGLVASVDDYQWLWRSWINEKAPPRAAALH